MGDLIHDGWAGLSLLHSQRLRPSGPLLPDCASQMAQHDIIVGSGLGALRSRQYGKPRASQVPE